MPHAGDTVLDIGCGAGVDLVVGVQSVGATGRVWGVDLTPAMARWAQHSLTQNGEPRHEARHDKIAIEVC